MNANEMIIAWYKLLIFKTWALLSAEYYFQALPQNIWLQLPDIRIIECRLRNSKLYITDLDNGFSLLKSWQITLYAESTNFYSPTIWNVGKRQECGFIKHELMNFKKWSVTSSPFDERERVIDHLIMIKDFWGKAMTLRTKAVFTVDKLRDFFN